LLNIGIIGTGFLGKAVATRLLDTGYKVFVYNRTKDKTESLKNLGAIVANTPKELAQNCDLVITIVKDADAVESVSFDRDGIIYGKHPGLTIADMSTISPVSSKKIAKKFSEYEIQMIDTPVMGGPNLAVKGEIIVMVGGKKEAYDKYKNVFDHIGNKIFYLGENGAGHAMKLAMNLQISMLALALSEGITLAKRSGLEPKSFLEILNSTYFKTGMSELKGPKMINGNFEPSFTLKMMKKDLDTINSTAREFGITLPMTTLANEIYQNAVTDGLGELDYTGILTFIEKTSKLKE
jgi:3-hydroxyisobutyrate dehydrogenase